MGPESRRAGNRRKGQRDLLKADNDRLPYYRDPAPIPVAAIKTLLIDQSTVLLEHAPELQSAQTLGLDTEFVRERTWHPQPGLLQFSDGETVWLLDPVKLDRDLLSETVQPILKSADTLKILHSVGEDLDVLDLIAGALPEPLFDTQRAAAMLGHPLQLRYEVLAAELTGKQLPGGLARNNWRKRPLPEPWLAYAADDVRTLPQMQAALAHKLGQADRLEWLEEDCGRMLARWQLPVDPLERIKGAASLEDDALERLSRLARWRDETARQRDLPRGFVVPDPALMKAAQLDPELPGLRTALATIDRVPRRWTDALCELLSAAPAPFQRPASLVPLSEGQRNAIKKLQSEVRYAADRLQVEPALIASRRDLTRAIQGDGADWLDGWRGDVLGSGFRDLLDGSGK